jgi:3-hydroxybutyryl-CoA dehydrogenase
MGSGIAEIVARNGIEVSFVEIDDAAVDRGRARIEASLDRQVSRGRLRRRSGTRSSAASAGGTDFAVLKPTADLVVEAVPEQLPLKQAAFENIDEVVREAIIATNTSSLPVMDIAVHDRAAPTACSGSTSSTPPR